MAYIILLIIIIISVIYIVKKAKNRSQVLFFGLILLVLFLVATGRAHWLSAIAVGSITIIKKLFLIIRYLPILQKFTSSYKNRNNNNKNASSMSYKEAAEILGVEEDATKEQIILAHKKAMQKHHPDKGGSEVMATKINTAKAKLLNI